ncbi:Tetrathionate response regulatory protein TtrR [Anaerohalosphaera lusitana]|uniref:Tetrathionate response regulatory protein TtrR n=2 Tax=Anaerohalosphaera lusitana TaxID=1936003 RepID=A0A1U9NJF1_9BACT|nr:Tetrathionate response regulatory protein TtrR [Anaerohalosphaera lusitana]
MNSGENEMVKGLQSVFEGLKGSGDGGRYMAQVLSQVPGGISISDMDGKIVFVNSVFARMFGYTPDEMVGKDVSIYAEHESTPGKAEALRREVKVQGEFKGEIYPKRRDGEQFTALAHMVQLKSPGGEPVGILCSVCEITDYKKTQEALCECESWSRVLVDTVPLGIQELDRDHKIVYCNAPYAQMLQYPREDVIGRKACDFASDEAEQARIEQCLNDIFEKEPAPAIWEGKNKTRQGDIIDLKINWNYRRDNDGKVVGLLAVVEDVTAKRRRKEMEQEWRVKLEGFHERMRRLTPREKEVMYLVAEGKPNKVVAMELDVSPRTVEIHRKRVMDKMEAGSLAELVRYLTKDEDLNQG